MKYQGCVHLWCRDTWGYIRRPRNILSWSGTAYPHATSLTVTVLGFTFFFESAYIFKEFR